MCGSTHVIYSSRTTHLSTSGSSLPRRRGEYVRVLLYNPDSGVTRPKHWPEFASCRTADEPLKMTIPETQEELERAWAASHSPGADRRAIDSISDQGVNYRLIQLVMRLFFRGIYFPQMNKRAWLKVIFQNRRARVLS
jgi:hypothetical protein